MFASGLGSNPPKEIKAAIKNLTNVLWNHIKAGNIDEKFIEVNFGGEYKQHFTKNRYKYLHQEQYNRIKNANSSDKEAYKLKSELGNLDDIFVNNEMRSVYDRINTGGGNSLNLNLGANAYDEEGIKHTNKFLDTYKGYRNNVPR
ncbi:MAG: hypothetical protein LBD75_02605 [Candidatus Peribacteria bacterium]|nr:hypothetical protein [Candidatus Peribacteria bacterium]